MMKIIKDNGLNTELQELFLVNAQWLKLLDFLKTELSFLEKRFGTSFTPLMLVGDVEKMAKLLTKAVALDAANLLMRKEINEFLCKIEEQMLNDTPDLTSKFLDEHGQLNNSMSSIMQEYNKIKNKVFALAEKSLKADSYLAYVKMVALPE